MKSHSILLLAAIAVLHSCSKPALLPEDGNAAQTMPVTFDLSASHPDATRAVKGDWETGDAIFVFFSQVDAPKYLKMSYDGAGWTCAEMNGAVSTPGCLGLSNGDSGSMRAVFLPFGNDATVSADADGSGFRFGTVYYTYYLTATLDYTVTDNRVSGAFEMAIPDNYVQFFVEDPSAADNGCTLSTDAVIPVGVASVDPEGRIVETFDRKAGDDLPGYAYRGGYLFSGKLDGGYGYKGKYYFAKTQASDRSRADYFVSGKELVSHKAVKLPSGGDGKWQPVGSSDTVTLIADGNSSLGTWHTCNYGQDTPESLGTLYSFFQANIQDVDPPTKEQFEGLVNDCIWTLVSVKGQNGYVVQAVQGFIFLPTQTKSDTHCYYWTSTREDDEHAWYLEYPGQPYHIYYTSALNEYAVRCLAK